MTIETENQKSGKRKNCSCGVASCSMKKDIMEQRWMISLICPEHPRVPSILL